MGEAWSDWYAMDYLVDQGLQVDRPGRADVRMFAYDGAGSALDRSEPLDCAVGSTDAACDGGRTGHTGGYTYADYGHVVGQPEVHADGEIWSQTLWDLRTAIGSRAAESLVTRAMELAPYDPSFIDMRNAILVADTAAAGGTHHDAIWRVFAKRGMGYYAGSFGGDDATPAPSFALPPSGTPVTGTVTGTVTDRETGDPVPGVPVSLAFQGTGGEDPTAVTAADGSYTIADVPEGHYAKLAVLGAGYQPSATPVDVTAGEAVTHDFEVRRDWAATSGGATASALGSQIFAGCAPKQAIDLNQSTVWSTATYGSGHGFTPASLVIDLGRPVDVTAIAVDPTAGCGDDDSSSLGEYRIDTAGDDQRWTTAMTGAFTAADLGRLDALVPSVGTSAVRYVRLTRLGNQTPGYATSCRAGNGADSGCAYTDVAEVEVFGTASP
jgi:hypothetical protein